MPGPEPCLTKRLSNAGLANTDTNTGLSHSFPQHLPKITGRFQEQLHFSALRGRCAKFPARLTPPKRWSDMRCQASKRHPHGQPLITRECTQRAGELAGSQKRQLRKSRSSLTPGQKSKLRSEDDHSVLRTWAFPSRASIQFKTDSAMTQLLRATFLLCCERVRAADPRGTLAQLCALRRHSEQLETTQMSPD